MQASQSVLPFHYSGSATSRCVGVVEMFAVQVSCSWDYLTRSASNLAYNYCLMGFEFVLPVAVIVICYVGIVLSVRRQAGELRDIQSSVSNQQLVTGDDELNKMHREKRQQEYKLAKVLYSHQHQAHQHDRHSRLQLRVALRPWPSVPVTAMQYVICTSRFVDGITSSNNGANGPESKTCMFLPVHQVAAPGRSLPSPTVLFVFVLSLVLLRPAKVRSIAMSLSVCLLAYPNKSARRSAPRQPCCTHTSTDSVINWSPITVTGSLPHWVRPPKLTVRDDQPFQRYGWFCANAAGFAAARRCLRFLVRYFTTVGLHVLSSS